MSGRKLLQHEKYQHDVNKINYRFIISVSERSALIGQANTVMRQSCSVHTEQFYLQCFSASISFPLTPKHMYTHSVFIILVPSDSALYSSVFPCFFLTYFLPHSVFSSLLLTLLYTLSLSISLSVVWPAGWKESLVYLSRCLSGAFALLLPSNCSRSRHWMPVSCVCVCVSVSKRERDSMLTRQAEAGQTRAVLTSWVAASLCVAHSGATHTLD